MSIILYDKDATGFGTLGLGTLKDAISCKVTEELNGRYECEFVYPITGQHYKLIVPDRIIKVKANEKTTSQLFRIYRSSKPINGKVKFYCQHISYDLNAFIVKPFGDQININATTALSRISSNILNLNYRHSFSFYSNVTSTATFPANIPRSVRNWLGGSENSILSLYGGEFEFDNFTVYHHQNRGQNRQVRITYGKNLKDVTADINIQSVYTSIMPYAFDSAGTYYSYNNNNSVIALSNQDYYGEKRTLPLDLSSAFDKDELITNTKIYDKTLEYISSSNIGTPKQNLTVSFVQLWQSEEYKDYAALERVFMGDTVTVEYKELGVDYTLKVVKTVYDSLAERYDSIELGDPKPNMADTMIGVSNKIETTAKNERSFMQAAIEHATEMIQGGLGGYVIIEPNESTGYPEEILIMDTENKNTAVNVIRINKNGIGFSSSGYQGPFNTFWTIDGNFLADCITAGTFNASLIKAGILEDTAGNTSLNMTNGELKFSLSQSNFYMVLNRNGIKVYHESTPTDEIVSILDFNGVTASKGNFDLIIMDNYDFTPQDVTINGQTMKLLVGSPRV